MWVLPTARVDGREHPPVDPGASKYNRTGNRAPVPPQTSQGGNQQRVDTGVGER